MRPLWRRNKEELRKKSDREPLLHAARKERTKRYDPYRQHRRVLGGDCRGINCASILRNALANPMRSLRRPRQASLRAMRTNPGIHRLLPRLSSLRVALGKASVRPLQSRSRTKARRRLSLHKLLSLRRRSCNLDKNIQRQRRAAAGRCAGRLPLRHNRSRLDQLGASRLLHPHDGESTPQARIRPYGIDCARLFTHDGAAMHTSTRRVQGSRSKNLEPSGENRQYAGAISSGRRT